MAAEIQETENPNKVLAASILSKNNPLPSSRRPCIFKVPEKLRTLKKNDYVPEVVSIGPYHRGKPSLQAMENRKHGYLQAFMSRNCRSLELPLLEEMVGAIRELETQAREYYDIIDLSSDEFVEMMLLDGCFILEILHRAFYRRPDYDITDPALMLISVQRDLVLLENQIPFLVLETIYSFSLNSQDPEHKDLSRVILSFFAAKLRTLRANVYVRRSLLKKKNVHKLISKEFTIQNAKHILDLIHSYLSLSRQPKVDLEVHYKNREEEEGDVTIHCVTDLWEAGVSFKRIKQDDFSLDIGFNNKHGSFEISPIPFHWTTVVLLRNLVAMEQCDRDSMHPVSSYVLLLDMLIKSDKDVRLLRQKKIVKNYLRNDEEMAVTISSLCQGIIISKFTHGELCHRCNKYLNTKRCKWSAMLKRDQFKIKWQEWKAMLKRDYFNSPWAVLSFIAAVLLLFFTFLQTFYTIRSYYPH